MDRAHLLRRLGEHVSKEGKQFQTVAIIGLNWLGDAVMAMPALQRIKRYRPEWRICMITKPPLAPLWEMHAAVNQVLPAASDREAIKVLRRGFGDPFSRVYVMPNSFRSAWWAWRGRVPVRIGGGGSGSMAWLRSRMLTQPKDLERPGDLAHQAHEMMNLFGVEALEGEILTPRLEPRAADRTSVAERLPETEGQQWIGLIPGAARGPSKQWPTAHFSELASRLTSQPGLRLVLLGTAADIPLCEQIAASQSPNTRPVILAGQTTLAQFTACLERCVGIVANDSGGMHLATAVGTPVVGLFGLTDPAKTGPLGDASIALQADGVVGSRDIPRESPEAVRALTAISPEDAEVALLGLLNRSRG